MLSILTYIEISNIFDQFFKLPHTHKNCPKLTKNYFYSQGYRKYNMTNFGEKKMKKILSTFSNIHISANT